MIGRDLLLELGFNQSIASLALPVLYRAPAQSHPSETGVALITQALQKALNDMGGGLALSGKIDPRMDAIMSQILGDNWLHHNWFEIIRAVISLKRRGGKIGQAKLGMGNTADDADTSGWTEAQWLEFAEKHGEKIDVTAKYTPKKMATSARDLGIVAGLLVVGFFLFRGKKG